MPSDRFFRGWSPLSRLVFPLNSSWHGLKFGLEGPNREIHFEWLVPQQGIDGELADYDWDPPNPDGSFTDLGYCKQRWTEGQMLDLGFKLRLSDSLFEMPIEFWPLGGFRWQRFGIMCYDCRQVKDYNAWVAEPEVYEGDVIAFNQQYYIGYFGGQLRWQFETQWLSHIDLRLQGDWGITGGYNEDHHLLREGDRWTMETTYGDSWHVAFTAEARLSKRWSLGFQADYLKIDTRGNHRWVNIPEGVDCTWSDGVKVSSEQTWLTVFLRLSI